MYIYNVQYKYTLSLHMKYEHSNSYLLNRHKLKNTQLSEVLNMTNEKPILVREDEDLLLHPHESSYWNIDFVGKTREIDFDTFTGMPKHLTS